MRKFFIGFLAATSFLFLSCSSEAFEDLLSKRVLDNGLTVLITEMPVNPLVSVYALVKTGSATEGEFLGTGITHFLEHMLFKGTHSRGTGEIAARIQSVGGSINASTSMDYTIYTITVPHESFDVALDVLSDMLMNATMDAEEIEQERNVIFGEMRMRNDDPDRKIGELTFNNVYIRHPYRHPIIGYKSLLSDVTREDLFAYYRSRYMPNNTILSVAGNIDTQKILPKIKETFKDFKRGHPVVRNLPQEPPQISRRYYEEAYPTDLTRLSMSFAGTSLLDPDLYALDVLAKILGQGKSSRLYLDVYREQGLVHSISASHYTPVDKGIFSIDCLLEQANVEAVIQAVLAQVDQIKRKGVKPEELKKAKQQVRSEHILHHNTTSRIAYAQAVDEAFTGDYHFSKKYVEAVDYVTNDDIKRVANVYLMDSRLTTVVLNPEEEGQANKKVETENTIPGDIQKHTLDNGLTVLLKEDHTFPLVALRLSANGGVRQETVELNGLFRMLASAWTRGTKRYSANQIAEKTEGLGMQLSGFSGRNSFGLSFEFLSEQLPVAFDLLEELMIRPTFPEDEIVKVKENMKAAIRQRDDDIFASSGHVLKETLFLTHPFRLEEEGTVDSVNRITRDDLTAFYRQFAVPRNMVLSVFGDINKDHVLERIQKHFGVLKDEKVGLKIHKETPPVRTREKISMMDKEQAMVMFGFHGVPLNDQDYYGIEVLTSVLGSPFSGRMFSNIRDQLGEAYALGGNFIPGPDAGFIYFYVLTSDEESEKVKELLDKEIALLQSEFITEKELENIKTYLKGMNKLSQETSSSLNFMVSLDELYGLGFERYRQYDEGIDQITRSDIQHMAKKYLDLNKAAIVVTKPESSTD